MAFTPCSADVTNISSLHSRPNDRNGLSAAQLQALFDKVGSDIKTYINSTLLSELEGAGGAGNIGIDAITGLTAATVQAALEELVTAIARATTGTLPDGSIATAKLADGAVTTGKLADANVTTSKIAGFAVTTSKIADANVTEGKLASGAVTNGKIADAAVTEGKLGAGAVTNGKLGAGAVTEAKITDAAVTYAKTSGVQQKHITIENLAIASITGGSTRSVTATGVTASNTLIVSPRPADFIKWRDCGVRCSAQGSNSLTFAAENTTGTTLYANVIILNK